MEIKNTRMTQFDRDKLINSFSELGKAMVSFGESAPQQDMNPFLADPFYEKLNSIILREKHFNGWFTEEAVRESLLNLGVLLTKDKLKNWLSNYYSVETPKRVGLIMAGNIPLVGFHDFLSVLMSGNIAVVKLSSDDNRLLPVLTEMLFQLQPELEERIFIVPQIKNIDAVIATGSNNSARYFEKYFGHLPNVIRKNRTSVAVLNGDETEEDLKELGKDLFTYFGLGCRNVSHLMIPQDFDLDRLFGAIVEYGDLINHHKYANNYDYYKAIYLLNREAFLENGFVLTKETAALFAPISVINYQRYNTKSEVVDFLGEHREEIQAVVGSDFLPFGKAQSPGLTDYADGIDTMEFLAKLD
jgi:hypothetical protein